MTARRDLPLEAVRRLPAWLAFALALALLTAQGFGSWHRVLHAVGGDALAASAVTATSAGPGDGHTAGSIECRLIDHLFHVERLPTAAPVLALLSLSPTPPSQAVATTAAAATARHYQARAPPLA